MKSWKQIVLCLLVIVAAGGGWYIYKNKDSSTQTATSEAPGRQTHGSSSGRGAPLVVVEPAGEETINNRLTAIG